MALAKWRENLAQDRDQPRNRVIKEKALFELALRCPEHVAQLRNIDGIGERTLRTDGKSMISIIKRVLDMHDDELPENLPAPLNKESRSLQHEIKEKAREIGEELGIAPELMLRKKESEALVRFALAQDWNAIENYFDGWRQAVLAEPIAKILKEYEVTD